MNLRLVANDAKSRIGALRRPRDNTPTDMARSLARVEASRKESATVSVRWAQEATLLQNPTQVAEDHDAFASPRPVRDTTKQIAASAHSENAGLPSSGQPQRVPKTNNSALTRSKTMPTKKIQAVGNMPKEGQSVKQHDTKAVPQTYSSSEASNAMTPRPTQNETTTPRTGHKPDEANVFRVPSTDDGYEVDDGDEEVWDNLIASVMGENSHSISTASRPFTSEDAFEKALPGMLEDVEEESEGLEGVQLHGISKRSESDTTLGGLKTEDAATSPRQSAKDRWVSVLSSKRAARLVARVFDPSTLENGGRVQSAALQDGDLEEETASWWIRVLRRVHIFFHGVRQKFRSRAIHKEGERKYLVSILVTPVKRLARDSNKSSKRVHFKLRKKSQAEVFQPLLKGSNLVQSWLMFLVIPMCFDIMAFGIRLAFCDLYMGKHVEVWYMDLVCDIWMLGDIGMKLITVVPKNTFPDQPAAANTIKSIAQLYFRHQFLGDIGPLLLYQVTSLVLVMLPNDAYHLARAKAYLWVWFVAMLPRCVSNFRRLSKYANETIIDPKITRNIKRFQFMKLVITTFSFAHLIGCAYYFVARIHEFDNTTWISTLEDEVPFYHHKASNIGIDYMLIIFKGFNRVAQLGYDSGLPGNLTEMLLGMLVMFLSVWIASQILGTLLTYLVRTDPVEVAHKERLEGLRLYMESKHVPDDLYEVVIRYCEFQYKKMRQNDFSSTNDLFKSLSPSLRIEVANAYHRDLINRCAKIGRPFYKCSEAFLNALMTRLYTVHVMPGDHVVHKDEIPRELYFVSSGAVQIVDEHDQVVSVIRSDVPDTAPVVGEVPFFLGINYLKAMKASLDGDVQLEVLSKQSLTLILEDFPEDHNIVCNNLWAQFGGVTDEDTRETNELNLDQDKLLTKKRILETTNFRKEQQFSSLCKAARFGDVDSVVLLARQGANLNQRDYDGRTAMHMACSTGRYKVVECLIKHGANENIKDRWGQTPMGIAILSKQQMVITVLAGTGKAKLDLASPELALCSAAGDGDLTQVKRLTDSGVRPDVGDYDRRCALHVAAAEGHEKVVEFLLLSAADPNCKDRWGGTPLQDALTGGHIGTAHLLKAKGAKVPDSFGAEAVCTAAGKGDVPKLRMLHSFGQSLDVGDYDKRNALHLASAEGRVLAVSFLLGISSDPNTTDRWNGTPMDDCVRGGTLYHRYCAKLLQGWGGELGTYSNTQEGEDFLEQIEDISIKSIREVIRRLIDQGLDKVCPERMDDQQLLVVMTATLRHMPLVKQLHKNTSVITKEMRHFRHVVHTFVSQVRSNVELVLETLLKGTRRMPEMEIGGMDDFRRYHKRPRTAKHSNKETRAMLSRKIDLLNGIEQIDNSRVTDSLALESPAHSHRIIGPPRKMSRKLRMFKSSDRLSTSGTIRVEKISHELDMLRSSNEGQPDFNRLHSDMLKQRDGAIRHLQSRSMAVLSKRTDQRADSLLKTLHDPTIPAVKLRDCIRLLKKGTNRWMTEVTEGYLDSDEEDSLRAETDSIELFRMNMELKAVNNASAASWHKQAARMFNQLSLHIVKVENTFRLLHQILCTTLPKGQSWDADPLVGMSSISRALIALQCDTRNLDLDKIVEQTHAQMKPFRLLQTPKERRLNKDKPSGRLRFSNIVAASSAFRDAILCMDVDRNLCKLMKSKLSPVLNEEQATILMSHAKCEKKRKGDLLHNDLNVSDHRYFVVVLQGEVSVSRTLDDIEIGTGICSVGCFFGAFKALQVLDGVEIPEAEKEVPFKEGGMGVNNCILSCASSCEIVRILTSDMHEVLQLVDIRKRNLFRDKLLERVAEDVANLENLNNLVLDMSNASHKSMNTVLQTDTEWEIAPSKRKFYIRVPVLDREDIQDSFQHIQRLWYHLSRGANTTPKKHVDLIKEHLGESGSRTYDNVFLPMEEPTAPAAFDVETFWFCWTNFLMKSLKSFLEQEDQKKFHRNASVDEDEDQDDTQRKWEMQTSAKGVLNVKLKHASKLSAMDFIVSGKADPYVVMKCENVTLKSQVKAATLDPVWDEGFQLNAIANRSIVRVEVFDSETLGQDRSMGSFSFIVPPKPVPHTVTYKLEGRLFDGRMAQGSVVLSLCFVRGAKHVKDNSKIAKSEFQVFCESENWKDTFLFWAMPSRRIESAFFKVPLPVHEREYTKAVGALSIPLNGLAIKQYLTYLLVEHSHQVDIYSCREFCGFFKRKLHQDTSIAYRDIVKLIKERASGVNNNDIMVGTALNPHHWMLKVWDRVVRVTALYHVIMVPIRIGFEPFPSMTSKMALSTDLVADFIIFSYWTLSLNMAYKSSKMQWVTSRFRIFKNTDWILMLACLPFEWIVFFSGMSPRSAIWFRLNKFLVYFSKVSPRSIIFSSRNGIRNLMVMFLIICHICACVFIYIGTRVPEWNLGQMNQISWIIADPSLKGTVYSRDEHFAMKPDSSGILRYLLSFYWVLSTITGDGMIGPLTPQNFIEILYTIILMAINLTIYSWISGELANMVMNADNRVIRRREEQDRILKFISAPVFTNELRDRIQSHLSRSADGHLTVDRERLLMSLSHGLRVELARLVWRDFLSKVHLFRGCSGQFLDAVCVLVYENHFGPEEAIGVQHEIPKALHIMVGGGLETYTDESLRKKTSYRKGSCIGILGVFFDVKAYHHTRACRSGATCIRLDSNSLLEVLNIYPPDEARVRKNALAMFSKEKQSDGSVTFSEFSDDDHSVVSGESDESGRSGSSKHSRASSSKSSVSGNSEISSSSHGSGGNQESKKKRKKVKGQYDPDQKDDVLEGAVSDAGGASTLGDGSSTKNESGDKKNNLVEEEAQLLKETDHIPLIKERMVGEKIMQMLTASARGDVSEVDSILASGDVTLSSKDQLGRTALHVACSKGHLKLVQHLIESKADVGAKDKFGNTPFNDAVKSKHDDIAKYMRTADPNMSFKLAGNELGVLLCQAASGNNLAEIKRLVNNGVDPNEDDYDGRTAMHLAASEGHMEVLEYLLSIKANIMCRDRFGGTPLEDAVRHNFEMRNAESVQKLLREHGATLAGEGLNYVVKMCEYAATGATEHIRLLATNGVDVSLGDYDDRTPLHLAACNGNTAVLEYLLKQETVLVNAVDRFGGTPYDDAVRHERKGAAALLEEAGCVRPGDGDSLHVLKEMIERSNMKKGERLRKEREPKIQHVLDNSQESKMVATISDKLSKEIADHSAHIELILQRLIWALRGFGDRLIRNSCNIPFTDSKFLKSTQHVLSLVNEMRTRVNISRASLMAEVQGDETAADCLIWRNASKEYKREARELDDQMRELFLLAMVTKRMLKEVIKVCQRGSRQELYAESVGSTPLSNMSQTQKSAKLDPIKLDRVEMERRLSLPIRTKSF